MINIQYRNNMSKNNKMTIEKLANMVAKGFGSVQDRMATKDDVTEIRADIAIVRHDMKSIERKLISSVEAVKEEVETLEEVDVRGLQYRVSVLEKDIKQIKHKHG